MPLTPDEIVNSKMYENDAFSKWLGIELVEIKEGSCICRMKVRPDMLNGFYIAHGGITYSLADSALAFASNSIGIQAVSIETSISHTSKVVSGDVLTATTSRIHKTRKFASYSISVVNQESVLVASFKGTVYYTGQSW
ncbi:MAG: hotdog fold thioesterase [Saprospiraceae bacterium]|nr:hotdog fold thioesterase [Saprospiraceae bacterium]